MKYLGANSRAPWLIERGTNLNRELFRLFGENLSKPAHQLGIKVIDRVFVREPELPLTLRLHQKRTPILEMLIFTAIFAYLYGLYSALRHFYLRTGGSKVKGT